MDLKEKHAKKKKKAEEGITAMRQRRRLSVSTQSNGDVWGSQSRKRGLHKRAFESSVGVLFMTVRGKDGRERKNRLRWLCRHPNAYKSILMHY